MGTLEPSRIAGIQYILDPNIAEKVLLQERLPGSPFPEGHLFFAPIDGRQVVFNFRQSSPREQFAHLSYKRITPIQIIPYAVIPELPEPERIARFVFWSNWHCPGLDKLIVITPTTIHLYQNSPSSWANLQKADDISVCLKTQDLEDGIIPKIKPLKDQLETWLAYFSSPENRSRNAALAMYADKEGIPFNFEALFSTSAE